MIAYSSRIKALTSSDSHLRPGSGYSVVRIAEGGDLDIEAATVELD